jgi:CheY-like chemotaxis protein
MDGSKSSGDEKRPAMRILVVDDSQDTARMMRVLLSGQGYDVKLALDGREAIELAGVFRPDVVLLDLILPDRDGAEVAEELRGAEGFGGTTFVAISGHGSDRIPAVFDRHFMKPVDHDALNGFLARLASGKSETRDDGTVPPPSAAES